MKKLDIILLSFKLIHVLYHLWNPSFLISLLFEEKAIYNIYYRKKYFLKNYEIMPSLPNPFLFSFTYQAYLVFYLLNQLQTWFHQTNKLNLRCIIRTYRTDKIASSLGANYKRQLKRTLQRILSHPYLYFNKILATKQQSMIAILVFFCSYWKLERDWSKS